MVSIKLTSTFDIQLTKTPTGLTTFQLTQADELVHQLLMVRLLTPFSPHKKNQSISAIDWFTISENFQRLKPVMGTKLSAIISGTYGVDGADLSSTTYELTPELSIHCLSYSVKGTAFTVSI